MIWPVRCGAEPQVPVQRFGHRRGVGGTHAAPFGRRGEDIHLPNGADRARAEDLNSPTIVARGVDLRAHLRCDLILRGELGEHAGLID